MSKDISDKILMASLSIVIAYVFIGSIYFQFQDVRNTNAQVFLELVTFGSYEYEGKR